MKRRFLAAFALGCALASPVPARAEQPLDAPRREKVRQLLEEGSTLEGKGDLQRAYVAYLAGWGLEHHFAVAANLGAVELQLGKPRDAAEHLTIALRAFPQGKYPSQRAVVEEKLREASKRVTRLEIQVDKPGAEVLVDGKVIGQSPLVDAIFVEPGTHKIEARLGGKTDSRSSTATAGGTEQIKLGVGESPLTTTPSTTSTVPTVTSEAPARSSSPSLAPVIVGGAFAVVGLAAGKIGRAHV
jgi:hypothetical protein